VASVDPFVAVGSGIRLPGLAAAWYNVDGIAAPRRKSARETRIITRPDGWIVIRPGTPIIGRPDAPIIGCPDTRIVIHPGERHGRDDGRGGSEWRSNGEETDTGEWGGDGKR